MREGTGSSTLPAEMRHHQILRLVNERQFVRVRELSERFGVSAVTVRNDLDILEAQGHVQRIHGGAMAEPSMGIGVERSHDENTAEFSDAKRAIARAAVDLVHSGEAVILDVGTTTAAVAKELASRTDLSEVTVFTNGLKIAQYLEPAHPRISVIVTGGTVRPLQHSLVNPLATQAFAELSAAIAFIGCNGVDLNAGVTNVNLPEAEVKRVMVGAAERRVIVADATKLSRVALARITDIDDVDVLVTDDRADVSFVEDLRDRGVDVVVATSSPHL